MKILNSLHPTQSGIPRAGNTYVLIMDKREAQTLVKMAEAAHLANKRSSTFRAWNKKLEQCLECF